VTLNVVSELAELVRNRGGAGYPKRLIVVTDWRSDLAARDLVWVVSAETAGHGATLRVEPAESRWLTVAELAQLACRPRTLVRCAGAMMRHRDFTWCRSSRPRNADAIALLRARLADDARNCATPDD